MRTLYSDEDIDILDEEYYEIEDTVFIHTNVKAFSLSKMKKYKVLWEHLKLKLKSQGYKTIMCVPPGAKEEKWESMFGFKPTGEYVRDKKLMFYVL